MNLLVVDDETVVRDLVERRLTAARHVVRSAEDADKAEAILRSWPEVEAVITDIRMPGRSGIDLLRVAKSLKPAVEVILMTGYAEVESAALAVDADAFSYLRKPFAIEELIKVVQRAAEHIALLREKEAHARRLEDVVRRLEASDERYRTLVEGIEGAVIWTDDAFVIRSASGRSVAILGRAAEDVIGKPIAALRPAEDAESLNQRAAEIVATGVSARLEGRVLRPDGSVIHTIEMAAPFVSAGTADRFDGLFWVIQDGTRGHELEREVELAHDYLEAMRRSRSRERTIIGESRAIKAVLRTVQQVAPSDAPVLVCGESGTGKELIAESIHVNSLRAKKPFVVVNCAALQDTLLESELFGHKRGSFTGAVADKRGLVEIADGGTLFADEITEMSPALQAKMLRVLERGEFRRVGCTVDRTTDLRVIAATNRELLKEVKAGRFREDLLYRLDVIRIDLPPLRERKDDIPLIAAHRLRHGAVTAREPKELGPDALEALIAYDWPGNIRELCNVIDRAVILSGPSNVITADHLVLVPGRTAGPVRALRDLEDAEMTKALVLAKGNKTKAAAMLGITRQTLFSRLKRLEGRDDAEQAGAAAPP